jgi:hypothetical protein
MADAEQHANESKPDVAALANLQLAYAEAASGTV